MSGDELVSTKKGGKEALLLISGTSKGALHFLRGSCDFLI